MRMHRTVLKYFTIMLVCAHSAQGSCACVKLAPEPANLSQSKQQIRQYRASGQWSADIQCKVDEARNILATYVPVGTQKLAVVFDVDETLLSNWDFIVRNDFGYSYAEFKSWEEQSKAQAIPQTLALFNYAREQGFYIFGITGRREYQRKATEMNLARAGFAGWQALYFKPLNFSGFSASEFKSGWRRTIQQQGYTIVLCIGDQMSDCLGQPQARHTIKLPNPMYFIP
jgi:acid phosphatase